MTRRAAALVLAGVLLGAGVTAAASDRHFLQMDGADWARFGALEREAWAQGFLSGHAVGRLAEPVAADTLAAAAELERRRAAGELALPYASHVYTARLGDYYRWENHQRLPLWRGMLDVSREMGGRR